MRQAPLSTAIPEQERASTGIPGLDDILGGGLPANHLYLVEATPGAGTTTLGLQFLRRRVENGQKGLYMVDQYGPERGQALTDFEGILSGVTSYKGTLPLLSDDDGKAGS